MLYYCLGGGFGHITRYLAFCNSFDISPDLITVNKAVAQGQIQIPNAKVFVVPESAQSSKENLQAWLKNLISSQQPEYFFIDAFPGGILGELCDLEILNSCKNIYLARILKWQTYTQRITGNFPELHEILLLEDLMPEQNSFLKSQNCSCKSVELQDKVVESKLNLPDEFWLIIHSKADEELLGLYEYALETAKLTNNTKQLVVVAPGSRPDFIARQVIHLDLYPAHGLFSKAELVFSGAGFNMVRQMAGMKETHKIIPFKRALDDQFFRAALIK